MTLLLRESRSLRQSCWIDSCDASVHPKRAFGSYEALELDVGAERGDEDWPAVTIVAGIVDVLQAWG